MLKRKKWLLGIMCILLLVPMVVLAKSGSSHGSSSGGSSGTGAHTNEYSNDAVRLNGPNEKIYLYASLTPNADSDNRKNVIPFYRKNNSDFRSMFGIKKTSSVDYIKKKNVDKIDNFLNKMFFNSSETKRVQNIQELLEELGVNIDNTEACNSAYKGHIYFSVSAPFSYKGDGKRKYTLKEVAKFCDTGKFEGDRINCATKMKEMGNYLRITDSTSNSKNFYYNETSKSATKVSWATMRKAKSGYGVYEVWMEAKSVCPPNITVKPLPPIDTNCNRRKVYTTGTNPTCSGEASTIATFQENIGNDANGEAGPYGLSTDLSPSSYCSIQCVEEANIELPKGYNYPLTLGTKLVFPSSVDTENANLGLRNERPLKFSGKKTCRVAVGKNNVKNCSNVSENYKNYLAYVKSLGKEKDYKGRTYDSIRTAVEKNGVQATNSSCDKYYPTQKTTNEKNSKKNCQNYMEAWVYLRNILTGLSKCDSFSTKNVAENRSSIYNYTVTAKVQNDDPEYGDPISLVRESAATSNDYSIASTCNDNSKNCWNKIGIKEGSSYKTINSLSNVTTINNYIKKIENRKVVITANERAYKLPDNTYNYISKTTNKAMSTKPADGKYTLVGYSNLPISLEAKTGVDINLSLNNVTAGHNGKFKLNSYVCTYEVTNSRCVCPEGTENAGQDLVCLLKEMSCLDAQAKYCDNETYKEIPICPPEETYRCKNTNNVGGKMDITDCVLTRQRQYGESLQQAIDYCDMVVCPLGIPIIYRVISLEDPFPGKNIANRVAGFNLNVTGRYPGANWDSLSLVKAEILNNRGVSANNVYSKEPLYVFDLDPKTVRSIRAYNDKAAGGYSDFTLNCAGTASDPNTAGTACISEFVHNSTYGLTDGTCQHATGYDAFGQCAEK